MGAKGTQPVWTYIGLRDRLERLQSFRIEIGSVHNAGLAGCRALAAGIGAHAISRGGAAVCNSRRAQHLTSPSII